MKFSEADHSSGYRIDSYGAGWIGLAGRCYTESLILTPTTIITPWEPVSLAALRPQHLTPLVDLAPHVVLIGSGEAPALLDVALYAPLLAAGIGVEVMTTAAACRTYNILMAEGRTVAAGLIVHPSAPHSI
ncbi:Uncharacterized conserved protein, contains Mth938-like domain [Allochromatium warmingii]|uniref:Uncharacterized conserved protein, contains Mth938-like domain n=1 Tax=Allochromatium warmingii TaxID=61595 RepID=A0A1H3JF83_ALLWA|nr:Mth938-like domain-containing protein [Allochromatium warmingii]SDY38643.1 Uncharacterized conserved protein, contains Mth938-like domain [Allochromatium warmingii]